MVHYFARRILIGIFTLGLITLVIYGLIRNMPGDPLALASLGALDAGQQVSSVHYEAMRKEMGLDRHWMVGYFQWLSGLLQGDLGNSLVGDRMPVTAIIAPRIGPTLLLSMTSLVLAYLLSIPLGLYCGVRSGTWQERTLTTLLYMLYSLPSFVAALYFLILFSVRLDWLPLSGMRSSDEVYGRLSAPGKAWDILRHLVLPVACSTYASLAYYVRFIRSNLQEVIRQDYIRTARAKGLSERAVVLKHAFRNTLIPLVTLFGLTLTALLSGSVILERIFGWPGIGRLFLDRIYQRDYPVIMGLVLLFSILVLAGNLLADLLYALVDPRISYS
jgi:peptide/nickel transport system permease protein